MHADELLDESELPIKYVGLSHCFRTEAGAAGRASRGLYRVHQFTKVEMFAFSTPEASGAMHAEMLAIEEEIFQALGIPYRVLDICIGRPGRARLSQVRPRGLDARPRRARRVRRGDQHLRLHRLSVAAAEYPLPARRARRERGSSTRSTARPSRCRRALIVILENYQRADGRIDVPEVLRPYVGKDVIGTPERRAGAGPSMILSV